MSNVLNGSLAAAGLVANTHLGGVSGLAHGAWGMAAGLGLVLVPFAMGLYRGGDAKLLIALGAWLGPALIAWTFLLGSALGVVGGLLMLPIIGREARAGVRQNLEFAARTGSVPEVEERPAAHHVPMAVAFSAGALISLVWRL